MGLMYLHIQTERYSRKDSTASEVLYLGELYYSGQCGERAEKPGLGGNVGKFCRIPNDVGG
jgi:hypothetical protein